MVGGNQETPLPRLLENGSNMFVILDSYNLYCYIIIHRYVLYYYTVYNRITIRTETKFLPYRLVNKTSTHTHTHMYTSTRTHAHKHVYLHILFHFTFLIVGVMLFRYEMSKCIIKQRRCVLD